MPATDAELDLLLDTFIDAAGVSLDELESPAESCESEPIAAVPTRFPSRSAAHRSPASGRQPLFFDLKTVPDCARLDTFGLPPVPEVPPESDIACCPDVWQQVTGTVTEIKGALSRFVAPSRWLDSLEAAEKGGKDRAGVHDLIAGARNVRQAAVGAISERIKLLSTTPEYCSIAAMGWAVGDAEVLSMTVGDPQDGFFTEVAIIEQFWSLAAAHYEG